MSMKHNIIRDRNLNCFVSFYTLGFSWEKVNSSVGDLNMKIFIAIILVNVRHSS